ncbi:MAG: hemerythrin, partial [Simplicispira sp.]|nr:hemerythrin [Simplicispira sp.]
HKQGHTHFVNKLHELRQKQQQGSVTVASQLSSVLRDWLSLHIRRNDKELRQFLQQKSRQRSA